MVTCKNYSSIFVVALFMISGTFGGECNCQCRSFRSQPICESIKTLRIIADTNTEQLLKWERHRPFVEHLSARWEREITDIVEMKIDEYIARGKFHPESENLVGKLEDRVQNDPPAIPKSLEDDTNVVSDLLVKVEKVENRTLEVEEELKSERRVRRDLEKEVKETRSSLISLGDQLHNATVPVDAMMHQVQTVIVSSIEDMNKTIYEQHLKKLYYRVDGVAYKNETKRLNDRLDHVEIELHDADNSSIVSKLAEDIKTLERNLHLLNNSIIEDTLVSRVENLNNSIGDVLIPRIQSLETVGKNVTDVLEDRMTNLLNHTELFRTALVDVWSDIQDIRDFEEKFQNFSEQWSASLKDLQSQVEVLKNESVINRLAEQADDTRNEIFQRILEDALQDSNDTADYEEYKTFDPVATPNAYELSVFENGSTGYEEDEIWEHPHVSETINSEDYSTWGPEVSSDDVNWPVISEQTTTGYQEYGTLVPEVVVNATSDLGRIDGDLNEDDDTEPCGKSDISDPNLLADVVTDFQGRNYLKFGCRPIGLYTVTHHPVPPRCEDGSWKGPFPTCTELSHTKAIETLAMDLQRDSLCSGSIVRMPDPTNCSQFLMCSNGKVFVMDCPPGLHFNAQLKVCDYPRKAACVLIKSVEEETLQGLIPPILIEPDNIDKPSSHLGTGSTGQLIVHPRSSFTLHCVYPENIWGYPKWNVTYTYSQTNPRHLVPKEGANMVSLTVTAVREEDSGTYRCLTPFGIQHAIEVVVKVVVCPAFTMDEEYDDLFYRPTPEGELRIMGTRVEFQCGEGHKVFAQCMADGTWSRGLPVNKECTLKKRRSDGTWNCKSIDVSKHPDLIVEKNNIEKIITFKCAGGKRLIGYSFTRCIDGIWSRTTLPKCKI